MAEIDPRRIAMDTAQVTDVAAYYRRSSLVLDAVADDLDVHEFGTWARRPLPAGGLSDASPSSPGPDAEGRDFGHLAAAYARMSADLATRLRLQARAAGELSDGLRNSAIRMAQGDEDAAAAVLRGRPAPGTGDG